MLSTDAMTTYKSIWEDVFAKLEEHLLEIREQFGIEKLAIFWSVSCEEDTGDSDVDILYEFWDGEATLANLISPGDFLEYLLGKKVDLVAARALSPYIRDEVIAEAVYV